MSALPHGEEGAWIAQARRLRVFACDAVFAVSPDVHVGPDGAASSVEWEAASVRLPPLDLPRQFVGQVSTAELLGREDALIGHYRRLLAVAQAHGKGASFGPFPYFRVQPAVIAGGETLTAFSWNDDLSETRTVLEILAGSGGAPRLLHDDQDQGWRILIVAAQDVTCFVEWDGEGPPPAAEGYAVDAAEVARQAGAALDRLRIIHERLVQALGHDHWTHRPAPPRVPPASRIRSALRRLLGADARSGSGRGKVIP